MACAVEARRSVWIVGTDVSRHGQYGRHAERAVSIPNAGKRRGRYCRCQPPVEEAFANQWIYALCARCRHRYGDPCRLCRFQIGYPLQTARGWWNQDALEIGGGKWSVLHVDAEGRETVYTTGALAEHSEHHVTIERRADSASITVDGMAIWSGKTPSTAPAPLALLLAPASNLEVLRFEVAGKPQPAKHLWLASEAISGAGIAEGTYTRAVGADWHAGSGAVCRSPFERAKWNFRGKGFRLWMPTGLEYGKVTVLLDGVPAGVIDLHAQTPGASSVVLERSNLAGTYHAVTLKSDNHPLPLDCLEAIQP